MLKQWRIETLSITARIQQEMEDCFRVHEVSRYGNHCACHPVKSNSKPSGSSHGTIYCKHNTAHGGKVSTGVIQLQASAGKSSMCSEGPSGALHLPQISKQHQVATIPQYWGAICDRWWKAIKKSLDLGSVWTFQSLFNGIPIVLKAFLKGFLSF